MLVVLVVDNLCSNVLMFGEHYAYIEFEFKEFRLANSKVPTQLVSISPSHIERCFFHPASNFLLSVAGWLLPTIDM